MVKLYAEEPGSAEARRWEGAKVTSVLTLTELVAAIWGKVRHGSLDAPSAAILDRAFLADVQAGRFVVVGVTDAITVASLEVARGHRLRAADALHLATALACRTADPTISTIAAFDEPLRDAAAAEGFTLLPSSGPTSLRLASQRLAKSGGSQPAVAEPRRRRPPS